MDNQTSFLRTIRTALGQAPDDERAKKMYPELFSSSDTTEILKKIQSRTVAEQDELVEILRENGNSLNICTHLTESFKEAAAVVVDLIRTKEPEFNHTKHVILHDHPDIAALQLWNRFNREAVTLHTTFNSDGQIKDKTIASFIGITAPATGVADSATLIQLTEPGRPRSTSLLPSIHIAILRRENLVANLDEAYALLGEKSHLDSLVLISGPSKTADIEAHMVHGAHGPRELHLIVLSEPQPDTDVGNIPEEQENSTSVSNPAEEIAGKV
ncbi:MAG: LUD domain-containing protein [Desulforhopalus sp.]